MPEPLPVIVSFWHGPLSWLERLCIVSFLRHGHAFHLYAYDAVEGLPNGAELLDAATILPREKMFFYKNNRTPAVFADLFRLELMRRNAGLWADCDIYCLKPFAALGDYVFGYEVAPNGGGRGGSINNAVFRCPAHSPLLADLIAVFDEANRGRPLPFLPPLRRLEVALMALIGKKLRPEEMQFGATGPFPLTWYVRQHGLEARAQPAEVFYPVPYDAIPALSRAGSSLDGHLREHSLALHLWRSQLTGRGRSDTVPAPEPGSVLAALCAESGIEIAP